MRILIAIEGSDPSDRAVRLVAAMPWPEGAVFRIVSVVNVVHGDPARSSEA